MENTAITIADPSSAHTAPAEQRCAGLVEDVCAAEAKKPLRARVPASNSAGRIDAENGIGRVIH